MLYENPAGMTPTVADSAVVHENAKIIGNVTIDFKCLVFNATLGNGVVIRHEALVEWVSIKAGREVPAMATLLTQKDVSGLKPVSGDSAAYANHGCYAKPICEAASNEQYNPFKTHRFHPTQPGGR